jgi:hypothetical protein
VGHIPRRTRRDVSFHSANRSRGSVCGNMIPSSIGSRLLWYVELPARDVRMPTGTTVASALDFRSRSFSRSPQRRNVRPPSSRLTSLRRQRRAPLLRGSGISDQNRKITR